MFRYISSMDWRKCGKFIMKVASDVLLLLCLHDFGLWVSVGLGQATAFLYSEARLYKGPRQSPLPQLTATRSTGNISVRTKSQPQQHMWTRFDIIPALTSRAVYCDLTRTRSHYYMQPLD